MVTVTREGGRPSTVASDGSERIDCGDNNEYDCSSGDYSDGDSGRSNSSDEI